MALTAAAHLLGTRAQEREAAGTDREAGAPVPGQPARGHGLHGTVTALRQRQPLAAEGIWRVMLAGEDVGRLVRRAGPGTWRLLQIDDLTDLQLETYEAAMRPARDTEAAEAARPEAPPPR